MSSRIRQHTSAYVSVCYRGGGGAWPTAASNTRAASGVSISTFAPAEQLLLYRGVANSSKQHPRCAARRPPFHLEKHHPPSPCSSWQRLLRQASYFCTSKASKLSTVTPVLEQIGKLVGRNTCRLSGFSARIYQVSVLEHLRRRKATISSW